MIFDYTRKYTKGAAITGTSIDKTYFI
jgi:hypothetical protein